MAPPIEFFISFKKNCPIIVREFAETVFAIKWSDFINIFWKAPLCAFRVPRNPLLQIILILFLIIGIYSNQIKHVTKQSVFYSPVEWRWRAQRRTYIYFEKPGFQILVYQYVESVKFEAFRTMFLWFSMNIQHKWFSWNQSFYYYIVNIVYQQLCIHSDPSQLSFQCSYTPLASNII